MGAVHCKKPNWLSVELSIRRNQAHDSGYQSVQLFGHEGYIQEQIFYLVKADYLTI